MGSGEFVLNISSDKSVTMMGSVDLVMKVESGELLNFVGCGEEKFSGSGELEIVEGSGEEK